MITGTGVMIVVRWWRRELWSDGEVRKCVEKEERGKN